MKLKKSFYSIFVEEPKSEQYIAYSTRSGKLIEISQEIFAAIENDNLSILDNKTKFSLMEAEVLVPEFENELKTITDQNKAFIEDNETLYIVIQPSANCQMGCDYCGQVHEKKSLSDLNNDLILKRVKTKLENANNKFKYLQIGWFGSEPLMGLKDMRFLTGEFKKMASEKGLIYQSSIVTNGLSLKKDIFIELAKEHNITGIEITLDGLAEDHDKRRFLKSRKGKTFDIIIKNLTDIFSLPNYKDYGVALSIRSNVDIHNPESVEPLIDFLHEKDFLSKVSNFYIAPIHSWGNEAHLISMEKADFADKEIDWFLYLIDKGITPKLLYDRKHEVCMIVDKDAELYDANGGVFNCTEVSYVPKYEGSEYDLGKLEDEVLDYPNKPLANWNDIVMNKEYPCGTCPVLPVCGGSCPKTWTEGIYSCPPIKHNIEDRIMLSYLLTKDEKLPENEKIFS